MGSWRSWGSPAATRCVPPGDKHMAFGVDAVLGSERVDTSLMVCATFTWVYTSLGGMTQSEYACPIAPGEAHAERRN